MNTIGSNNAFSNYVKTLVNDKYGVRSGYAYYDSLTHYYLGRYLRDYKAEKGIDLTSMYNCYSESIISGKRIKTTSYYDEGSDIIRYSTEIQSISGDSEYDLVYIPILPKDVITLCFESDAPVTVTVGSYNGIEFVDSRFDNTKVFSRMRTKNPIKYVIPDYNTDQRDNSYRVDNLVLLVQIPKRSLKRVILLGDYSNLSDKVATFNSDISTDNTIPNINSFYREGRSEAFLDELIPYLLSYAITENDDIFRNKLVIQKLMSSYKLQKTYGDRYKLKYRDGNLDANMREWIKAFQKKHINNYNNIGRINKDVEELLNRGGATEC